MADLVTRTLKAAKRRLLGRPDLAGLPEDDPEYWEARAGRFGRRSVLHLGHGAGAVDAVTERQEAELFPHLRAALDGTERTILDFGCGCGRFTGDLARLIGGRAIGIDPSSKLLSMAPASEGVEYRVMSGSRAPLEDASVDVVWSAVVLGCITGEERLRWAASEMLRVLRPGGLLFLAENTSAKPSGPHFVFRTIEDYQALFSTIPLACVSRYEDLGETISALTGRQLRNEAS